MSEEALKQSHAALLNALECMVHGAKDVMSNERPAFSLGYYIEMAEDAISNAKKI